MTEIVIFPDKPQQTADQFRDAVFPTLLIFQKQWLAYNGSSYQPLEDETIRAKLAAFLRVAKVQKLVGTEKMLLPYHPKAKDITEVYSHLADTCHIPKNMMSPPIWLEGTPAKLRKLNPKDMISFENGLLHIPSRKLYPATAKFFTLTGLPIVYDAKAPEPERWNDFLKEVTADGDDARPELATLIRQMIGYCISSDTSMQKIFFLCGRTRSGKGTILRVLTELVGPLNTDGPTIKSLAGDFGRQNLIGKSLATITDMNCDVRSQVGEAASILNGVSGEDFQSINRKHKDFWSGTLPTRFVLASNMLPNFGSHTGAIATRLLIIPFDVSFVGREDRGLTKKLMREAPGIINQCLDALEDLNFNGDFEEPAASYVSKQRLIYRSNPIHGFIEERCTVKAGTGADKTVLYTSLCDYCDEVGAKPPSLADFSETLCELYPSIKTSKRRHADGTEARTKCYRGVRLNNAEAVKVYVLNPDLVALGYDGFSALMRDAAGWPIASNANDFGP
jgi:putative DNA primase/helicase